jgi:hypothetical protein
VFVAGGADGFDHACLGVWLILNRTALRIQDEDIVP